MNLASELIREISKGVSTSIPGLTKLPGKLPLNPLDLMKSAKAYLGGRGDELKLGLFLDPRLGNDLIDELTNLFVPADLASHVYVHILSGESLTLGEQLSYEAAILVLQHDDLAHDLVNQAWERELPLLLVGADGKRQDWADRYQLSILDVLTARHPDTLPEAIALWFAHNLGEHRVALAADFAFMRPALAKNLIASTAQQNAVIGFIGFIPGADMPVMTLNQAKMVLQLALLYGQDLTVSRVIEVALVALTAFGARALARLLVNQFPKVSWVSRSAVGFSSTFALGYGALLYFENGGELGENVKGFAEGLSEGVGTAFRTKFGLLSADANSPEGQKGVLTNDKMLPREGSSLAI